LVQNENMQADGLWTAYFTSGVAIGTGVIVLVSGRLLGGDHQYFYTGSYKISNGTIIGDAVTAHFAGQQSSIFGPLRSVRLTFEGQLGANLIVGRGYAHVGAMPQQFSITLRRVSAVGEAA
jgi:hypothetical protein